MTQASEPHAQFWHGAVLFDRGEFFQAHEAWEERWRACNDERERLLLQGLIQVAAAFHKRFMMRSLEPAQRLLARGLDKLVRVEALDPMGSSSSQISGFDLAEFIAAVRGCSAALARDELDRAQLPRMLAPAGAAR